MQDTARARFKSATLVCLGNTLFDLHARRRPECSHLLARRLAAPETATDRKSIKSFGTTTSLSSRRVSTSCPTLSISTCGTSASSCDRGLTREASSVQCSLYIRGIRRSARVRCLHLLISHCTPLLTLRLACCSWRHDSPCGGLRCALQGGSERRPAPPPPRTPFLQDRLTHVVRLAVEVLHPAGRELLLPPPLLAPADPRALRLYQEDDGAEFWRQVRVARGRLPLLLPSSTALMKTGSAIRPQGSAGSNPVRRRCRRFRVAGHP